MKILHIVPTYLPAYRYGGPIKTVHELNKRLVKNGAEVIVYTTNIDGKGVLDVPLGKEVIIDGVKVYYFPITFRLWQYSYLLHRILAKNVKNFDLIHITSVFLSASTLGAYYAKKFNKPYIISPRGSLMREPLKRKSSFLKRVYIYLIEKKNLAGAAAIHFTVEIEKDEYLKNNFPFKKAIIIPNGLDAEEFEEKRIPLGFFREKFNIPFDKKNVLFLGRLSWKKGFDTLIPAFSKVIEKEPKTILTIAGGDDENYKKEIEKLIKKYNIKNQVIFTGMLLGDDKISAYQDSNVFVLPSYAENFGQAVVESMACGLAVVVTKNVGIAPNIEKAAAGLVIEKGEKQLTEAILKILSNPELAKKIGETARQLVKIEFSWPKIANKFIKEYNNLIIKS
ncbi:MAG: glycosyltransferase [Patescibacteria group bacterium]